MIDADIIKKSVQILENDGVILYPSDTIWGLGCDILSKTGVERIYEIKEKDRKQPLLLLASSIEMLKKYIVDIHPRIETLLTLHKQPLTIIYKANERVPEFLLTEKGTIGIRVVQDEVCKDLIEHLGRPITSTSANISGSVFPNSYEEIEDKIRDQVDHVLFDAHHHAANGKPSVVATFDNKGELLFLRK
jgi:L-threonylcarbamoyladenylate synthase